MAVDPNRPPGLPTADPAAAVAPGMPGDPAAGGAPMGGGFPSADPGAMMGMLQAIQAQDHAQLQQQQDAAAGMAVTQLLRQTPNAAGEAATTLPGSPTPPPLPGGPGGGDPMAGLGAGGGY